jgi:acyl-CoA synthetase (AMP-forming)/AMP-acid ligase II
MALIDLIASVPADNIALVRPESDFRLTYEALRQQVRILAGALTGADVQRNERVAIALPDEPALVVAILAASTIGAAVSFDDRAARAVIVPAESPDGVPRVQLHAVPKSVPKSVPESVPESVPKSVPESVPESDPDSFPDAIAVILQTQGTTGPPKRVPLSHENLTVSARQTATRLGLGPTDVTLCVMPIAHVQGLVTATLATLAAGGTVVIPGGFHPLAFWRLARDYGMTWFTATPTIHQWLLARTADPGARRPTGAARLRFIRSAGSVLPPAVARTLESAFGVPVLDGYEVTEASGDVSASRLAILDADGRPLEPGGRGEVALAGPSVARGYDNDPESTRKFFVDGWFRTGDFGYLDRGRVVLGGASGPGIRDS